MQIKTTLKFHLTSNAGKAVGKKEPFPTIGASIDWYNHNANQYGDARKI